MGYGSAARAYDAEWRKLENSSEYQQLGGEAVDEHGATLIFFARVNPRSRSGIRSHTRALELQLCAKRCIDVTAAFILLLVLAPGMLVIAFAIKMTSPGPVLFRQQRYGLGSQPFESHKFRTMYVDAGDLSGTRQTRKDDPRVTPLGRLLRRSSLDELPQLWNVLKGDMSLVGPRPHVPGMLAGGILYEHLVPYYFERHCVRPGITGLAQVNGLRGGTEDPLIGRARIDQDLLYIEHWSLTLDARILWQTFRAEFLTGNGI
jgi:lipopolysaccharide/colanic/teichoic acid biosynthesis glycosyltransferase